MPPFPQETELTALWGYKGRMKTQDPGHSKMNKLKLSEPLRGIVKAKPTQKRGPQIPKSSKRPQ